jgi:hypothetical protein
MTRSRQGMVNANMSPSVAAAACGLASHAAIVPIGKPNIALLISMGTYAPSISAKPSNPAGL